MTKKKYFVNFLCLLFVFFNVFGIVPRPIKAEAKRMSLSAESAILMDVQSGAILYQKNMDKQEYPASITKIMTTLVALENSSMSETITFSESAVTNLESGASNINTKPGEKMSMEDSLYAVMLASANEVCNGVAEHIAGSIDNYVDLMNKKAKELGCTGTHFANTNGLWMENHYTTAHDMALIARAAYLRPDFAKITGTKKYYIEKTNKAKDGHYFQNHHGMFVANPSYPQYEYKYCVGGKTGFTSKCRYTLVTYAKKNDMTLVSVVMRADSPWDPANEYTDSTKILNYGFENYARHNIQDDAAKEINSKYLFTRYSPYYNQSTSSLTIDDGAGVILPKNVGLDQAEKKVEYFPEPSQGSDGRQVIGKITYTYKNKEVGGSNIYYAAKNLPTLNDSINMSEWFEDAVEEANKEPFPWVKAILIGLGGLVLVVFIIWFIQKLRAEREQRLRKNRYKRSRRNTRRVGGSGSSMDYRRR